MIFIICFVNNDAKFGEGALLGYFLNGNQRFYWWHRPFQGVCTTVQHNPSYITRQLVGVSTNKDAVFIQSNNNCIVSEIAQ